jgi:hypothetical protein
MLGASCSNLFHILNRGGGQAKDSSFNTSNDEHQNARAINDHDTIQEEATMPSSHLACEK